MASHATGYNFKTGGNTFSGNQLTKAEFGIDGRPDGRGVQPHNYDLPSGLGVNSTTFGGSPYRISNSNNGFKPYQPFSHSSNNNPTLTTNKGSQSPNKEGQSSNKGSNSFSSGKKANLYSKNLTWQDWLNKGILN